MTKPARAPLLLAAFVGLGLVGGIGVLLLTRRFEVEGNSMLPTYAPGDRVLVNRYAYLRADPQIGDVVVVRQPGARDRLDIKRLAQVPGGQAEVKGEWRVLGADEWYVLGDNPEESTDSRQLGPVRRHDIEGKVVLKY